MDRKLAKSHNISVAPPDAESDNDVKSHSDANQTIMLIKKVCNTIPEGKYVEWTKPPVLYSAPPLRLSFCVVQNDMDGIWNQIFNVLRNLNDTTSHISDFLGETGRLEGISEKIPSNSKTVLFVRDPYIRLFFDFYDRFYVLYHGCQNNSFQHYIDRIISGVKLKLVWGTEIMPPFVPKCKPCDIKRFEIIREESFHQDLQNMFKRLKLSGNVSATLLNLLDKPSLFIKAVLHSKLQLQLPLLQACPLQAGLVVPRFWTSLQNMGIISKYLSYPTSLEGVDVTKDLTGLVLAAVHATKIIPMSEKDRAAQKREAIADAYADIKDETVEYIKEIFKYDFEMFGYSKERPK